MPAARTRTPLAAAAVLLLTALGAWIPAPAAAAAPPLWAEEAAVISRAWPGLQDADGHFRDYILARDPSEGRDDYGDAMLGYALLLTAARSGDTALADSALRALEYALAHPARGPSTRVFADLSLASAYNVARASFADRPAFQRARPAWEAHLRAIVPVRLRAGQRVTNKSIVEAVVLLEVARSGLADDPDATVALVTRFLRSTLPAAAKPFERGGRAVLGDLPLLPPAYHGLSVGMLGRAIALLGDEAPSAARRLLERAATTSVYATDPEGDVAYYGRSQLTAWTLTLTAYGSLIAAQPEPWLAPAFRRLAFLTLHHLTTRYSYDSPEGFFFTPSLEQGIEAAIPGLDEYVAATPYVGLTLATLEWAIGAAPGETSMRGVGTNLQGFVHGTGSGAWATAQDGRVWYAVRPARTSLRDLRYDFGLVALKHSDPPWRDVMPVRPRTVGGNDTAGPVLTRGGSTAGPEATSLETRPGGVIVARGGFRTTSGRWLRRGVRFVFKPVGCGVRLTFPVRAGDRLSYSAFFDGPPHRSGRAIRDSLQHVSLSRAASVSFERGYSSGDRIDLHRARIRFPAATRSGSISITTCAR